MSAMAAAGTLLGCATNPVTGESQLMLVSEDEEIQLDRQHSPLQFSTDYGISQDKKLNQYVSGVGKGLAGAAPQTSEDSNESVKQRRLLEPGRRASQSEAFIV